MYSTPSWDHLTRINDSENIIVQPPSPNDYGVIEALKDLWTFGRRRSYEGYSGIHKGWKMFLITIKYYFIKDFR